MNIFASLKRSISPPPAPITDLLVPELEDADVTAYRDKLASVGEHTDDALTGLEVDIDVDSADDATDPAAPVPEPQRQKRDSK